MQYIEGYGDFPIKSFTLLQICSERKHAMYFFPEPILGPMLIQKCVSKSALDHFNIKKKKFEVGCP